MPAGPDRGDQGAARRTDDRQIGDLRPLGRGHGAAQINRYRAIYILDDQMQQLADALEVSRQSVNAIETGKYDPSLPLAFRIADVFGLTIEQIFLRD